MSGLPGTFRQCRRYPRIPADQRAFRTLTSGPVLRPRLARITFDVTSDVGGGLAPSLLGNTRPASFKDWQWHIVPVVYKHSDCPTEEP